MSQAATKDVASAVWKLLHSHEQNLLEVLRCTKLIIWDLDQTFWRGVLAEGTNEYLQANHDLVVALSKRGIINSICSHNHFEAARRELQRNDIYQYFVFPHVSYEPKGQMIKDIIHKTQLRPKNVLFIEDNARLRQEAQFWNDGIGVIDPSYIATVNLTAWEESDPQLERLQQYRVLEAKDNVKSSENLSNEEFLRRSQISVHVIADVNRFAERIFELINRTNQLNFTKSRVTNSELQASLADPQLENRCLHVRDKFGDYGIAGFYSLDRSTNTLRQLVFSCRILNMGIEQYVYHLLGKPSVKIVGEVSSSLEAESLPDWINLVVDDGSPKDASTDKAVADLRILIKGGCDLESVADFIKSMSGARWHVDTEFHYQSTRGAHVLWQEHTDVIRHAAEWSRNGGRPECVDQLPFFDERTWSTKFCRRTHDVYVLSLLQDYGCGTYRYRDGSLVLPCEYFGVDMTDPSAETRLFEIGRPRCDELGITVEFLRWFRTHFRSEGAISSRRFQDNICWLVSQLPPKSILIVLNGAEVALSEQAYPFDGQQAVRHRQMNDALLEILPKLPNVRLVDVREFVRTPDDLTDRLFHYQRSVYNRIASAIVECITQATGSSLRHPSGLRS